MESLNARRALGESIFKLREFVQLYDALTPEEQVALRRDAHSTHGQFSRILFDHAIIAFGRHAQKFPLQLETSSGPEQSEATDAEAKASRTDGTPGARSSGHASGN